MDVFMYQAALYCEDCGDAIRKRLREEGKEPEDSEEADSDDWPAGPYADGGGEADSFQHCDACGAFLDNPLTDEGVTAAVEMIREGVLACLQGRETEKLADRWNRYMREWAEALRVYDVDAPSMLDLLGEAFEDGAGLPLLPRE